MDGVGPTPTPDLPLYLDASRSGWGAHFNWYVSGVRLEEKLFHINLLEMKAMFLALQSFREEVADHHVTEMCDTLTETYQPPRPSIRNAHKLRLCAHRHVIKTLCTQTCY